VQMTRLEGTDPPLLAPLTVGGQTTNMARQRPPQALTSRLDPTAQLHAEAPWRQLRGGTAQHGSDASVPTSERPNHSEPRVSAVQTPPEQ